MFWPLTIRSRKKNRTVGEATVGDDPCPIECSLIWTLKVIHVTFPPATSDQCQLHASSSNGIEIHNKTYLLEFRVKLQLVLYNFLYHDWFSFVRLTTIARTLAIQNAFTSLQQSFSDCDKVRSCTKPL